GCRPRLPVPPRAVRTARARRARGLARHRSPRRGHPMLTRRVIPCLDCRDGRVVKGVRFAALRDAGDPVERARAYESEGADELVLLDVSATPEGRRTALDAVARVRTVLSIPLTVGGG